MVSCSTVLDGSMAFDERVYGKNGRSEVEVRWQSEKSRINRMSFRLYFKFYQKAAMGMEVLEEVSTYGNHFELMPLGLRGGDWHSFEPHVEQK